MAEYKTAAHTFLKDGIFYFIRRIPTRLFRDCVEAELATVIDAEGKEVGSEVVVKGEVAPKAPEGGKVKLRPMSLLLPNKAFGFRQITVERPQRDEDGNIVVGTRGKQAGKDFLTLAEGLAMLLGGSEPEDIAKDEMLRFVCNGASFHGPSRPLLLRDVDAHATLRKVGEALVDKFTKQTDLVRYSRELGDRNEVGGF